MSSSPLNPPKHQVFHGLDGLENFYREVYSQAENELLIFVSPYDRDDPSAAEIIEKNISLQKAKGVHVRALSPLQEKTFSRTRAEYLAERLSQDIEVRFVPSDCSFPAQILIFGDTIGFTSMKKDLTCGLMPNANIAQTLRMMFEYMWRQTKPFHDSIVENDI